MQLKFETVVPLPLEPVFRFHTTPDNLALLLEGWPGFSILRHDGRIEVGSTTWTQQLIARVLPVVVGFRHTRCEPPLRFEEQMIHGPYKSFVHTHEFEELAGATRIRDRLTVTLPWWYGGELGVRYAIAPWLRRFFAFRHQRLAELVEAGALMDGEGE